TARWKSSNNVGGTLFQYHEGASTTTSTVGAGNTNLRLVASVTPTSSYGGGGIVLDTCLAAGTNTALQFTISGTTNCAVELQVQTYAQKPTTDSPGGGCASNCTNKYPRMSNLPTSGTVKVTLANLSMWTAAMAGQIVGVQWQLTVPAGSGSCAADLRLDDVKFVP
ncbi:MAG TPA: hypothetical protein VHU40_10960, partial [Polyangia bacterium]|nr:hypothetical protein [Polyangia bacterium]